jgi:hypothetical protein
VELMEITKKVRAEWGALVGEILGTPDFVRAEFCTRLLQVLLDNYDPSTGLSGKELADLVYKQKLHAEPDQAFRQLVMELRVKLRRYSATEEGQRQRWCCLLPNGISGRGYMLRFVDQWNLPGASGTFWQAHRQGESVPMVVFSEALFFVSKSGNALFHWADVSSPNGSPDVALRVLKEKHPEVDVTALRPCYPYIASTEIKAQKVIQDWFETSAGNSVTGRSSRRVGSDEIASTSPILLGKPHENGTMREMLEVEECGGLRYSYATDRPGVTLLKDATEDEIDTLSFLPASTTRRDGNSWELIDTPDANGVVFGTLLRMPNPYGEGVVTIISAHDTRAVEQCAKSLTDDARIRRLFANSAWNWEDAAPERFEAVFAVRTGPASIDADARPPELIGLHVHRFRQRGESRVHDAEMLSAS